MPDAATSIELTGACRLAMDLGFATGHADTYEELLAHVQEQREEARQLRRIDDAREAQARAVEAFDEWMFTAEEDKEEQPITCIAADYAALIRAGEVTP